MATYGLENHRVDRSMVALVNGAGEACGNTLDVEDAATYPDMLVVRIGYTGGFLSRREAIYLRNRLTAFIEKGLDDLPGAEQEGD